MANARSIDSMHSHHPSRSYIKQLHGQIKHMIPEGVRICGEDVYAKHAIYYPTLTSYFYVFAVFEGNTCVACWPHSCFGEEEGEGYVVRLTTSFYKSDFSKSVGKFVRPAHVSLGTPHWMSQEIIPNKLAGKPISE